VSISFHLLLLFAVATVPASARDVTVRLYSNQSASQLTLVRGAVSSVVKAGSPALHIAGPWQVRTPGQDWLSLFYPLAIRTESGHLTLTITVPLEEYVSGVLAGESVGFRSAQSLAAMAVAARTYAIRYQGRHKSDGYDFCDTTHCQDLRISSISERLRQAAESTEGELLWFEGAPASSFCSSQRRRRRYRRIHSPPRCSRSDRSTAGVPTSNGRCRRSAGRARRPARRCPGDATT
jgi:peptidoglycan hydrolase-like amidase